MNATKAKNCPFCDKPSVEAFGPFCSAGCKDRDLLQWLGGGYKMPGPPVSPDQITRELGDQASAENEQ